MKIVISGSAGIGKTTLAKKISSIMGYTYIPDQMDVVLRKNGFSSPKELNNKESVILRLRALKLKIDKESKEENFVSDKGVIDYYAYWLIWCFKNATDVQNRTFIRNVRGHLKNYDLVIIPKFGRFKIKDNKIRETDINYQYKIHSLIKELYHNFKIKIKEYDFNLTTPGSKIVKNLGIR